MTLIDILNVIGVIWFLGVFILCVILGPRRERYIRPTPLPPVDTPEDNGAAHREMLRHYRKQKLPPTRDNWE